MAHEEPKAKKAQLLYVGNISDVASEGQGFKDSMHGMDALQGYWEIVWLYQLAQWLSLFDHPFCLLLGQFIGGLDLLWLNAWSWYSAVCMVDNWYLVEFVWVLVGIGLVML